MLGRKPALLPISKQMINNYSRIIDWLLYFQFVRKSLRDFCMTQHCFSFTFETNSISKIQSGFKPRNFFIKYFVSIAHYIQSFHNRREVKDDFIVLLLKSFDKEWLTWVSFNPSLVAGNASVYSAVKDIHTLANNLHNNVVEINENQVAQTTCRKKPLV